MMISCRARSRNRFKTRSREGAAAIEFALVVPLFLLVVAGIVEFGQAFRTQHVLTTASRRAARALTVDSAAPGQVKQDVYDYCEMALGNVQVSMDVLVDGSNGIGVGEAEPGDDITVTVSVPYSAVGIAIYANLVGVDTLSATCTLEHE